MLRIHSSQQGAGISADGQVVVGYMGSSTVCESFRWDAATGLEVFSNSDADIINSANAISDDGKIVVGNDSQYAYKWTRETGLVSLVALADYGTTSASTAWGVSADGSIIAGNVGDQAIRWTQATGFQLLGQQPRGTSSNPTGGILPIDPPIVVDASSIHAQNKSPIVPPIVGFSTSQAWDMTPDGPVIVIVPPIVGFSTSQAWDMTPDGSMIVGGGFSAHGSDAFIWTQKDGMQSLTDMLVQGGVDLAGWQLGWARGVSDNGQVIIGSGINPQGQYQAWVIILAPEPSALMHAISGFIFFGVTLRRGRHSNIA